ncbi:MAG: HU family DNA-binding protein, partial [Anaerolineae bacterium]|nr:HU family DNA-binding protein [Anaerolineae bacterium]
MDELVNLIMKKTGLPKETAEKVVNIVIQFLKDKLPDQFDALVD